MRTVSRSDSVKLGIFAFAKGIGIILVILTHTFAHLNLEQSTSLGVIKMLVDCTKAGLMPMFFVISGFGLVKRAPGKMLKKTFSELVIPYLWVTAAFAVIFPLTYCMLLMVGSGDRQSTGPYSIWWHLCLGLAQTERSFSDMKQLGVLRLGSSSPCL